MANPYTVTRGTTAASSYSVSPYTVYNDSYGYGIFPNAGGLHSVMTQVTLPNNKAYTFSYDPTYGVINKITYPTGGYVSYSWGINPHSDFASFEDLGGGANGCQYQYGTVAVMHRYVSFGGVHIALQQDFSYSTNWGSDPTAWSSKTTTVTTHDLVTGKTYTTVYTYSPITEPKQPNVDTSVAMQIPVESSVVTNDSGGSALRTVHKWWEDQYELSIDETTLENG